MYIEMVKVKEMTKVKKMTRNEARTILAFMEMKNLADAEQEAVLVAIDAMSEPSKLKKPCDSLLTEDPEADKEHERKLEPSGDLISREDAIEAVANAIWHYPNECYYNLNDFDMAEALAKDALKALPSAEAEGSLKAIKRQIDEHWYLAPSAEAVQGEWGHMIVDGDGGSHWYEYECSHCGEIVLRPYNFCPNCGTEMAKGGNDTTGESL